MYDYNYNKLIGRIIEKFGTRRKFAKAAGLSENWLSLKLSQNGEARVTTQDIEKWSPLLDIDPMEYGEFYFTKK